MANLNYVNTDDTNIQQGQRPVIVISNEKCNQYSPVITVIPLTTSESKNKLPTHVIVTKDCGMKTDSIALVEQQQSIDKYRIMNKVGECTYEVMEKVEKAIGIQLNLPSNHRGNVTQFITALCEMDSVLQYSNTSKARQVLKQTISAICTTYNVNIPSMISMA